MISGEGRVNLAQVWKMASRLILRRPRAGC